jgi:hypothetical protein
VLRAKLAPEDYWKERKKYENGLKGKKIVHLFLLENAIICEKI